MPVPLTEAQVTKQCVDFLEAERWKCVRLQSGLFQRPGGKSRVKVGEEGIPDYVCFRQDNFFFLEFKRKGGRVRPSQKKWIAEAEAEYITVVIINGLDILRAWLSQRGWYIERYRTRWNDNPLESRP